MRFFSAGDYNTPLMVHGKRKLGIVIAGPTGIGKTEIAAVLATHFNGELISSDSVQVYSGLTIGANKTDTSPIPQHLIDILHWKDANLLSKPVFTAASFTALCSQFIVKIAYERDKTPILVGGTGLYLDWVVNGRPGAPPSDPDILNIIQAEISMDPDWETSLQRLSRVDPEYAKVLQANDYYRLYRALTIHRMTGSGPSVFKDRKAAEIHIDQDEPEVIKDFRRRNGLDMSGCRTSHCEFSNVQSADSNTENEANHFSSTQIDWKCFYVYSGDRFEMLRHIDSRCERMIQKGLVHEVIELLRDGLSPDSQPGRAIGYAQTIEFIKTLKSEPNLTDKRASRIFLDFIEKFQNATRGYTRRQENWFNRHQEYIWVKRGLSDGIEPSVDTIIKHIETNDPAADINSIHGREHYTKNELLLLRNYRANLTIYNNQAAQIDFVRDIIENISDLPA